MAEPVQHGPSGAYAVYRLAPIGVDGAMEVEDVEHWACSPEHAELIAAQMEAPHAIGVDFNYAEDTVCEWCFGPAEVNDNG